MAFERMIRAQASSQSALGVHLPGSINLPSAKEVFVNLPKALPNRLRRIPDGETAHRQLFVTFQRDSFKAVPQALRQFDANWETIPVPVPSALDLEEVKTTLTNAPLETHYEDYALESYSIFKSLQASGEVPAGIKFQVSLPSPLNVLTFINEGYQATVEPFYTAALLRSLKTIQDEIPASDLAIQWDVACDFAMIEGIAIPALFKPWFEPVKEGVIERLTRLVNSVSPSVECGLHLCYGDIGHKHFKEPEDVGHMVGVSKGVLKRARREVDWIHMPVPKDRFDDGYFRPLKEFEFGRTELYLGLVHYDDLDGTRRRIEVAAKTGKEFGIGTECGMGRTPLEHLQSILEISAMCSSPVL